MANASGPAIDGVIPADFRHAASGVHYRVYEEKGKVWMSYEREAPSWASDAKPAPADLLPFNRLRGQQELLYFIGSGKRGRTYLFDQEGYWFESPINWYANKRLWDMTPNHLSDREMPLTLPVDPGCLHCHATGAASWLPDARNHCLNCHARTGADETSFAATHHPENLDCTACHMARASSSDIAYEQVTDHLIRKHLTPRLGTTPAAGELEAVGSAPRDREVGLAYAQMAQRGDQEAGRRAIKLLTRDEEAAKGAAKDPELHSQLGFLEQVSGHTDRAEAEYEQALQTNPFDSLALGDLALIKAKQHQYAEAEQLWKTAFDHDPVQTGAGLNLAIVACETGKPCRSAPHAGAPAGLCADNWQAGNLATEIRAGTVACSSR